MCEVSWLFGTFQGQFCCLSQNIWRSSVWVDSNLCSAVSWFWFVSRAFTSLFWKRLADFSWTDHIIARLAALPGMPYWSNWLWESMTWMRPGDKHDQSRTFSSPRLLEWPSGTCDMLANQKCNDFALSFSLFITVKVCSWTYCQKSKIFKQDAKCKKLVSYEAGSQKPSTNNWRLDWTLRCFLGNSNNCFVGQDQKWHSHVSHTCWALSVAASIWPRRRTMKKIFRRL